MASSIERFTPKPPAARKGRPAGFVTIADRAITPLLPAIAFGNRMRACQSEFHVRHDLNPVGAIESRARWLPWFARADAAAHALYLELWSPVDQQLAVAMIGAMLRGFDAKPNAAALGDILKTMLGMISPVSDAIAQAMQWRITRPARMSEDDFKATCFAAPIMATPTTLALALRELRATKERFVPTSAELCVELRKARNALQWAHDAAERCRDYVRQCDALLLAFDHTEWQRPYLTPEYRALLQRMLMLHGLEGDGSQAWDRRDDDGAPPHPFELLVQAEKAKLLPAPEPEPEVPRLAACVVKLPTKKGGPRDA